MSHSKSTRETLHRRSFFGRLDCEAVLNPISGQVFDEGHDESGVVHSAVWHDDDWLDDRIRLATNSGNLIFSQVTRTTHEVSSYSPNFRHYANVKTLNYDRFNEHQRVFTGECVALFSYSRAFGDGSRNFEP
ncbi:hypothetical protein TNCV_2542111 [Trichonephila clavipes]|nr:hypothetical protein TNCV_2542111 [Trichonephila clavipes]